MSDKRGKKPFNKKRKSQRTSFRQKPPQPAEESKDLWPMRLNKYVAYCGICSRRKAADFVKEGVVTVNGEVIIEPFHQVNPEDKVTFKGKSIKPEEKKVYLLLNKPKDYITTLKDEKDRKTVMDIFKGKIKERIFPVGRLDRATTGLLIFTNDGDLAEKLAHPRHKVKKFYQVVLHKAVTENDLEKIRKGLILEDGVAEVDGVDYVRGKGKEEVGIEIHIGKNRIVRRIFEHLDYKVLRLDRVYYAGLTKKDLPRGFFRHLTQKEIIMLKHFI